jgi:WD40 repeat protein
MPTRPVLFLLLTGLATGGALARPGPPPSKPARGPAAVQAGRQDALGDPLPEGALARLGTLRFRHRAPIECLAVSPDGRLLATGNGSGPRGVSVALWDAATGRRLRMWGGQDGIVRDLAFSPDSKLLVWVSQFGVVNLYDVTTGEERWWLGRPHDVIADSALIAPDGKILVIASRQFVRRWDLATCKELAPLRGHQDRVFRVAVSSDGRAYATCAADGTVRVWGRDGKERKRWKVPEKDALTVAFAPGGKLLACGTLKGEVIAWDVATGRELWRVRGQDRRVWSLAFSPDGVTLASAGDRLRLRDAATGVERRPPGAGWGRASVVAFAPDGKRLVAAGDSAVPGWWDTVTGKEVLVFDRHHRAVRSASFSPDGKTLATASDERLVRLWDVAAGKLRTTLPLKYWAHSVVFTPDGKGLAVASAYYRRPPGGLPDCVVALSADSKTVAADTSLQVGLWDVSTGKLRRNYDQFRDRLALTVGLWDVSTGKQRPHSYQGTELSFALSGSVSFALSPDGRSLAVNRGNLHGFGVVLWDATSGKVLHTLAEYGKPAAFSPDGRAVAIFSWKMVLLVEVATARELVSFEAAEWVRCAAFSPDGSTLATGGARGTVQLWEVATGGLRHRFTGHEDRIDFVVFSPDGRRLASGGEDMTVLVWDLAGRPGGRLGVKEQEALWADLAGSDAARAYRAIRLLGTAPEAVTLLRARLRPVAPAEPGRVRRLIAALDSDDFAARQRAAVELGSLGHPAVGQMRAELAKKWSLELHLRLRRLLDRLDRAQLSAEELRSVRGVEALERLGSAESRALLGSLARGAEGAPLTERARAALRRLEARGKR